MEKKDYFALESICQLRFQEAGPCFHVCTQEDLPIVFHNESEFKASMNVIALVCICCPEVKVYTFAVMDNHLHFLAAGREEVILDFAGRIIRRLALHPSLRESCGDILKMTPKVHPIENVENLRNVIAYIHRNGPLVNPDESAFSYEWGAGRFFFNREAKARFRESSHLARQVEKRSLTKSHYLDHAGDVFVLDGYISPLCYCKVGEAELFFRNNRQYFYKVSKNIESQRDIAKTIGETIFYTDYDLIDVVTSACRKKYGVRNTAELNRESKIELAKTLRYEYNAGNKQISRLLKISMETVSMLFSK